MRTATKRIAIIGLTVALLLGAVWVVSAAPDAFSIPWWRVAGGGGTSDGGNYSLSGTAGQAEAGIIMSGDGYTLAGGFWGAGMEPMYIVYLPQVLKSRP